MCFVGVWVSVFSLSEGTEINIIKYITYKKDFQLLETNKNPSWEKWQSIKPWYSLSQIPSEQFQNSID